MGISAYVLGLCVFPNIFAVYACKLHNIHQIKAEYLSYSMILIASLFIVN